MTEVNGWGMAAGYGDPAAEHAALTTRAGVVDLSSRARLCVVGADRARFLHGQVTNDIRKLRPGEGCYTAITTAKGKMESDANVFCLGEELLLDAEPGQGPKLISRLGKYMVADDVQIVDVAAEYGLLSVLGPRAEEVIRAPGWFAEIPGRAYGSVKAAEGAAGETYLARNPRLGDAGRLPGFDLFVPAGRLAAVAEELVGVAERLGGRACGWQAFETCRIEAGIPRFGMDMDENQIPLECGLEARAITYTKGCYIGQEVINRIHSVGHVNRELRGLWLADDLPGLPGRGEKLFHAGKEAGYVTSAVKSPRFKANIALGYVRREAGGLGTELSVTVQGIQTRARVTALPFRRE